MVLDIPNAGLARAVLPQQIIVQIAREILTATASLRHGTLLVHLYAAPAHPRAGVGDSQGSVRERGVGCVQASPLAPRGIAFGNFRFQLCAGATRWIRKLRSRNSPDSKIPIGDRTSAKCDSPAPRGEGRVGISRPGRGGAAARRSPSPRGEGRLAPSGASG